MQGDACDNDGSVIAGCGVERVDVCVHVKVLLQMLGNGLRPKSGSEVCHFIIRAVICCSHQKVCAASVTLPGP